MTSKANTGRPLLSLPMVQENLNLFLLLFGSPEILAASTD